MITRYFLLFVFVLTPIRAWACDLCGCYTPQFQSASQNGGDPLTGQPRTDAKSSWHDGLYGAVAEQFTYFNTLQIDGREVENPTDQYLASSITQFVVGYAFSSRFALQVNVPLIYRSFERPEGFAIDRGTESGLGDVSLLGRFVLFHKEVDNFGQADASEMKSQIAIGEPAFATSLVVIGGVKFPTGSASRIKEEFNEIEVEDAPESGIHGHDLTLGTGSYDGIFGGQASVRYRQLFAQADVQFTLRSEGSYGYQFANDLTWSGGPGYYFVHHPNLSVGAQFVVSGEHKGKDCFRGEMADDTGITSVFVGARLVASVGKFSAEIGTDLPVSIDNTALQAVPDYRIRGGIALRF